MPETLEEEGFFFYSNERSEPCHIHVRKGDAIEKVWLEPELSPAYFEGFSSKVIKQINQIVIANFKLLKTQ